ncbi:hypothetical protein AMELA_G00090170 [Ameiurus melas]|uniref:Uncharacterized protein n=1 Tax=Ameiurus melas TaxID=219545 RepID=A0A7J6AW66_AMEME|nr:hypothetical protein AMELA_G00090170 [Ameiurus melas]
MQGANLPSGATLGSVSCPRTLRYVESCGPGIANRTISGQPALPPEPQPPLWKDEAWRAQENHRLMDRGIKMMMKLRSDHEGN